MNERKKDILEQCVSQLTDASERTHREMIEFIRREAIDKWIEAKRFKTEKPFPGAFDVYNRAHETLASIYDGRIVKIRMNPGGINGWFQTMTRCDSQGVPSDLNGWSDFESYALRDKRLISATTKLHQTPTLGDPAFVTIFVYHNPIVWEWL